jgi:hypothetical protein
VGAGRLPLCPDERLLLAPGEKPSDIRVIELTQYLDLLPEQLQFLLIPPLEEHLNSYKVLRVKTLACINHCLLPSINLPMK